VSRDLHVYRCSFCKTTAQSTFFVQQNGAAPLKCTLCFRIMGYLFSSPISEAEWEARNLNPPVFQTPHPVGPAPKRECDQCRQKFERHTLINVPSVGKFCSEDCAQVGVLKHQAYMEKCREADNRWKQPYKKPQPIQQKESA
jgi:hypothetical protein